MKNNHHNTISTLKKTIVASVILMSLIACGGGGGNSSNGDQADQGIIPPPAQNNPASTFQTSRQTTQSLTTANAEQIALEVVQVLSYFIDTNTSFAKTNNTPTINPAFLKTAQRTETCIRGGTTSINMSASSQLSINGNRVWGAGDSIAVSYNRCGVNELSGPFFIDGTMTTLINQGVFDDIDAFASPTQYQVNYEAFGFYDIVKQLNFKNGAMNYLITENTINLTANQFFILATANDTRLEFFIDQINLSINDHPSIFVLDDAFQMEINTPLIIESNISKARLEITNSQPIIQDHWLNHKPTSGKITIKSASGNIDITLSDGFFDYTIDIESDGFIESQGTVFDSNY